jgi:hypothetical protein
MGKIQEKWFVPVTPHEANGLLYVPLCYRSLIRLLLYNLVVLEKR